MLILLSPYFNASDAYGILAYWNIIKLSLDIAIITGLPDYISPEIKQSQYDMMT